MNIAALRAAAQAARESARALLTAATADGGRELNAEEATAFDTHVAEAARLDAQVARVAGLDAAEAAARTVVPAASRGTGPVDNSGNVHAPGPEASREFESLGQFMHAVRFNPNDSRLRFDANAGSQAEAGMTPEQRAAQLGVSMDTYAEMRFDTGSAGGFAIPPTFRAQLLELPTYGEAPIRAGAMVISADPNQPDSGITMPAMDQSGNAAGHVFGGITVGWVAEGGQKPLTDMALKSVTVETFEAAGYMIVTDKLLRNWSGADATIRRQFRAALLQSGEYAFLRGDGVTKPKGIIGDASTIVVNRATALKVSYVDLVNMVARLLNMAPGAFWLMPQGVLPQIATLKDEAGNLIWQANARDGFAGTLLGYPVKWSPFNPALGTSGDVMLIDPAHYIIKDGSGPFVAASEHVLFTQNKTVIKAFWNVGGKPWLTAPHTDEGGYQVSPFVQLGPVAV